MLRSARTPILPLEFVEGSKWNSALLLPMLLDGMDINRHWSAWRSKGCLGVSVNAPQPLLSPAEPQHRAPQRNKTLATSQPTQEKCPFCGCCAADKSHKRSRKTGNPKDLGIEAFKPSLAGLLSNSCLCKCWKPPGTYRPPPPHPLASSFTMRLLYSAGKFPPTTSKATWHSGAWEHRPRQHGRLTRTLGSARENLPLALISYVHWVLRVKANESLEASQKNNNRFYYVGWKPGKMQSAGEARTQRRDSEPVLRSHNANLCLAAAWLELCLGLPWFKVLGKVSQGAFSVLPQQTQNESTRKGHGKVKRDACFGEELTQQFTWHSNTQTLGKWFWEFGES